MKSGVVVTALVAGGVACVCAAATSLLLAPRPVERPVLAAPQRADDDAGLLALLDEQARELELLRARLEELEARPSAPIRLPIEPLVDDGELLAQARPAALTAGELPDAFVADVDAALQQIRAEERREAEAQRYERQLEGIDRRVEKLADRLGLSGYQTDEMRDLLRKQAAAAHELKLARKDGQDKQLLKEQQKKLDSETKAALATILTPEQLADYQRIERRSKSDKRVLTPEQLKGAQRSRKKDGRG